MTSEPANFSLVKHDRCSETTDSATLNASAFSDGCVMFESLFDRRSIAAALRNGARGARAGGLFADEASASADAGLGLKTPHFQPRSNGSSISS